MKKQLVLLGAILVLGAGLAVGKNRRRFPTAVSMRSALRQSEKMAGSSSLPRSLFLPTGKLIFPCGL